MMCYAAVVSSAFIHGAKRHKKVIVDTALHHAIGGVRLVQRQGELVIAMLLW